MKATRVRYKRTDVLLESPELLGDDKIYKAVINTQERNIFVFVKDNGEYKVVKALPYTELSTAKREIKVMFKKLGVNFLDEIRNKKRVSV